MFTRSVRLCPSTTARGTHLSIDGFTWKPTRPLPRSASLGALEPPEGRARPDAASQAPAAQLSLTPPPPPRRRPGRRSSNATASRARPRRRLRHKRPAPAPAASRSAGGRPQAPRVVAAWVRSLRPRGRRDRAAPGSRRFLVPASLDRRDKGFAAARVFAELERRRISAFIPPQPNMLPQTAARTESQRLALAHEGTKSAEDLATPADGRLRGTISEAKLEGTLAAPAARTPLFHVQVLVDCPPSTASASCATRPRPPGGRTASGGGPASPLRAGPSR